jgi:hypothetical protein
MTRSHGLRATYQWGCRCPDCTEANNSYGRLHKSNRKRRVRLSTLDGYWPDPQDVEARGLRRCILSFGVPSWRLAHAMGRRGSLERLRALHWGAWRVSREFQGHCDCPLDNDVRHDLEEAS